MKIEHLLRETNNNCVMRKMPQLDICKNNTSATIRKRKGRSSVWKVNNFLELVIPVVAAIICYSNSLHGDFVHDDIKAISGNSDVTGENSLRQVFLHDFWGADMQSNTSHKSYRPITILTFR